MSQPLSQLPALPAYLDAHQREGVKWILTRRASYLAHAPGAGKTCQAITAAALTPGPGQVLFIVPPTLTTNWAREVRHWCAQLPDWKWREPTITVVSDTRRKDQVDWYSNWVIVPDSMITRPWVRERIEATLITRGLWKFIAVDEASRFKEESSERSRVLFGGRLKDKTGAPGFVYHAKHVVLLDGSPMPNRAMELWAPTYALSPESIHHMNYYQFGQRYGAGRINSYGKWEFKGTSNHEELRAKLTRKWMHVVSESELDHPERLRSVVLMTKDIRSAEHRRWEVSHLSRLNSCTSESNSQGDLAKFRRELGVKKVAWTASYIKDRVKQRPDESLLVFAWHREVVVALSDHFPSARVIMGGTSTKERDIFIRQFQNGKIKMLIMNIAAAGRGHNLQKASRVIFAEYSWSDEMNRQAEKRASRMGSDQLSVRCEYIVSPGSMDEVILKAVMRKARNVERVIG